MELTLESLRQAGVYAHALQTWDDKPEQEQSYANFKTHFTLQEKNRLRNITAKAAGFNATQVPATPVTPPAAHLIPPNDAHAAAADAAGTTHNKPYTSNGVELVYCWTHGLSKNAAHSSKTCENKAEGHNDAATLDNRMGGVNRINFGRSGKKRE
jgi:hypothetical protein